jgi:hypothetical protein
VPRITFRRCAPHFELHGVWHVCARACARAHVPAYVRTCQRWTCECVCVRVKGVRVCVCAVGTFQATQAYFQQLLPPSSCDAEDGRRVGHELHDLVDSKPADLRRAIRTFADRSKMLRECGFRNIGDMLVAMFTPSTTPQSAVGAAIAAQDSGSISKEQAALIGSAFIAQLRAACKNMSEPASIGAPKRRDSLAARVPSAFSGIFRSPPASRSGVSRPVNAL